VTIYEIPIEFNEKIQAGGTNNNCPVKKSFLPREKLSENTVHHVSYITFRNTIGVTEYAGLECDKTVAVRDMLSYGQ
jgi:hypothetical protein